MSAEQQALPPELIAMLVTPSTPSRVVLSDRQRQELEQLPPILQGRLDAFTELQEDVVYNVSDPFDALEIAQTNVEDETRAQEALHFVQQMLAKARVGGVKAVKSHCDPKGDPTAATWLTTWAKQNPESRILLTALLSDQLSGARSPSSAGQGVYTIRCIEKTGDECRDVIISVHGSGDTSRLYMAGSWSKGTYESLRSNLIDLARGRPVIEGPWASISSGAPERPQVARHPAKVAKVSEQAPKSDIDPVSRAIRRTGPMERSPGEWTPQTEFEGVPVQESPFRQGLMLARLTDLPPDNQRRVLVERMLAAAKQRRWSKMEPFFNQRFDSQRAINEWRRLLLPLLKTVKPEDIKISPTSFRGGDMLTISYRNRRIIISLFLVEDQDRLEFLTHELGPILQDEADYFPPNDPPDKR